MAKFKKTSNKTSSQQPGAQPQAEGFTKMLTDSAQQVWLAGVGAFGRAQTEGGKLFENLVKEGLNFEQTARKFAGGQANQVRDVVESRVGQARERATDTWDRLERVFEDRVQRALTQLGVPGREDLNDLSQRVEALTTELRRQNTGTPSAAKATVKKAASSQKKSRVKNPTPTAKKAVQKPVAKKGRKASTRVIG